MAIRSAFPILFHLLFHGLWSDLPRRKKKRSSSVDDHEGDDEEASDDEDENSDAEMEDGTKLAAPISASKGRSGKPRKSDLSEDNNPPKMTRAERLSARTQAKVGRRIRRRDDPVSDLILCPLIGEALDWKQKSCAIGRRR